MKNAARTNEKPSIQNISFIPNHTAEIPARAGLNIVAFKPIGFP
ncbi:hypothetical protein LEP1GSC199_0679 [Leptospira vanthielii serovar Holland str. Waz Holland = ATCC 700522]|uniref:Uncharacterized protein n=1 Tax=Leptospira vanthielii serovar Holland str. Waz Holland = ATCC 700522 TaxID=1218591 RepID=N1W7F0_9LEPT|nr:hypothetical protein LEP1GSC199_0679 [Leptospira vanthielii serovar Holland str. Waz Holland = ATCC 700522]